MSNVFSIDRQSNQWDNLVIDVKVIYELHPIGKVTTHKVMTPVSVLFQGLYKSPFIPLSLRHFLRKICFQIHLDESWFYEFAQYWSGVLGGRPLWGVQDFYFLMNFYRIRFQSNQIPDTNDANVHLAAWQRPELLYQLLHLVYKETIVDYVSIIKKIFQYKKRFGAILEFGCGTAPITASLYQFLGEKKGIKVYFSDIQTVAFHYAAYRFVGYSGAEAVMLSPENDFEIPISGNIDIITCLTVFEHLNKPLKTVRDFYSLLSPNGLLFFDYIKTEGEGLDTFQGAQERLAVLNFVREHFDILEGELSDDKSTDLIVARKRNV